MLNEYRDIVVEDLPNELTPRRNISHHIDFIPGASLPNKEAYRLTPQENEELRKQGQGSMNKGLVQKSMSPCVVLLNPQLWMWLIRVSKSYNTRRKPSQRLQAIPPKYCFILEFFKVAISHRYLNNLHWLL